jgi:hypothetical protein
MHLTTRALRVFAVAAILLGLVAIILSTVPARAQVKSGTDVRISELERRAASTDADAAGVRGEMAKLSDRLARVEALSQNNNTLLLAVLGTLAIMLIERAIRIGVGRRV